MRGTVLSLFTGACAGWDLGLSRAGYRTVAMCEADPWRRSVLAARWPGVAMWDDVRDVSARSVRDRLGYLPAVVVGSPPCQDISTANHRGRGVDGERSGLFFEAVRVIAECRPVWAALENSPNLRARGADRVLAVLEGAGYACWPLVVGADNLRAPHRRKRVWLIGVRDDAHADREGQHGLPWHGEVGRRMDFPANDRDADEAGLALGQGERGDARPELAALERAVGPVGLRWNGGPARHLRVADGLPAGLARDCIAAYGDAIVPQIATAIGRVMARLLPEAAA